jgi:hypothetical protein
VNLPRWAPGYEPKQPTQAARTLLTDSSFARNPFPHSTYLRRVGRFHGRGGCESSSMGREICAQATRFTGQNASQRPSLRAQTRLNTGHVCGAFNGSTSAEIVNLLGWGAGYVSKQPDQSGRTLIGRFPFTQNPFPHLACLRRVGRFDGRGRCESAWMGCRVRAQAAWPIRQNAYR